ncbi:MAG: acetate--CoA ligase family protein [Acidimicrobiales bacterium]
MANGHSLKAPLDRDLLEKFVNPRSVAIIGASANVAGMAGRAWVNLERTGYGGRMHLVNPNRDTIGSHPTYASIADIDDELDAAIILVSAALVPDAVEQCAARGIPAVTVCTAGFSELGEEGAHLQSELAATAAQGGCRLIGPNCTGTLNVADNYVSVATYNITYDHTPGDVTLISHSGGMAVNLFNRAQGRGVGIRALFTLGNEADIDLAEMVDALVDDEKTQVIALFMERLNDGRRFLVAARRAHGAGKPIVALKVGRSAVGQRSVASHTGALAGEPEVYTGVLRQAGVLEVNSLDELLNVSHLLATVPRPAGPRVGVFTVSGGESSYFADRATPKGLEFPMPTPSTASRLDELVRFAVPGNPFDATGQVIGDPEYARSVVETFCNDDNFDSLSINTPTWSTHDAEQLLPSFIAAAEASPKPTVICSWSAGPMTEDAERLLRNAAVPSFETTDEGVDALAGLTTWHHDMDHVGPWEHRKGMHIERPLQAGPLDEYRSKQLLAEAGVPFADEVMVPGGTEVKEAVDRLGGDAVVKLVAGGLVHKTELGLVRVGVTVNQVDDLLREFDKAATDHDLAVQGYLVGRRHHGIEMIVGAMADATFGPLVMIGTGGIHAEQEADVRFLAAPASPPEIACALRCLRSWPILAGSRGETPDIQAFAAIVEQVSSFIDAGRDWVETVDLNPVLVGSSGAVAVDATVVVMDPDR